MVNTPKFTESTYLCEDNIKVCCVLHNFVRERYGYGIENTLTVEGLFDMNAVNDNPPTKTTKLRDMLITNFSDEGSVYGK